MQGTKYRKLKRISIVLSLITVSFFAYVEISNRNFKDMTFKQKFLKTVYPALMWISGKAGGGSKKLTNEKATPNTSFYTLSDSLNNGTEFDFVQLKGKKVMLVNTASDCGYTNQYDDLQKLSEQYKDKLVVIGFPANDFKEQEKGSNEDIASFCKINFGVTFPLMKKSSVVKGAEQNKIFNWLADAKQNGWNDEQPSWNFCKYIVDEDGRLTNYFGSAVEPLGKEVAEALNH